MILRSDTYALKNQKKGSMLAINKNYNFTYDLYFVGELLYSKGLPM